MLAEILHEDGCLGSDFSCDEPVSIRLSFEVRQPSRACFCRSISRTWRGPGALLSDPRDTDPSVGERVGAGLHTFEIQIPPRLLAPTTYLLSITSTIQFTGDLEHYQACCEFTLRDLSNPVHQRTGVLGAQ